MAVLALRPGTPFDHFHYLVFCSLTREAAIVDPYDVSAVHAAVAANDLRLTTVINTHEHWDHAGRNSEMKAGGTIQIMAPRAAAGTLQPIDRALEDGDRIDIGHSVSLAVLATPGHTMAHISLGGRDGDTPFLISGDTLFAGGAGNCNYGGHAPVLFDTLARKFGPLEGATVLYPGHDYLARNLRFAAHVEPSNPAVEELASQLQATPPGQLYFTTMEQERRINPFLRCSSPGLRQQLARLCPHLPAEANEREVFVALRHYRDQWADQDDHQSVAPQRATTVSQ
ncbi:hydroxyacylglutathione hydrolase C-terminal domain-containing protein [Kineobactrum salinum]|uniref:MBL fold metallo-hydrolase n=1 Tax=Kineobactrum salinum TaxID=2708301 RepID=A0A6C0U698_9GAMM|nr:hydroxyacylglutathione hydrolase C-terminal domain-containing protein [Kineobactrum salinum]QIB66457.1 MBL fold metallo-hydrolase [Kineobactrum salinum]